MSIQHIRLLHEVLFCAVAGALASGLFWLMTGSMPGLLSTLLFGWSISNGLHTLTERRRVREVRKLTALHELPATDNDQ